MQLRVRLFAVSTTSRRALADGEALQGASPDYAGAYVLTAQAYLRKAQADLSKADADRAVAALDKLATLKTDNPEGAKTAVQQLREAAKRIPTALAGYDKDMRAKAKH